MDYEKLAIRLAEDYERICDQYIDAFLERHNLDEFEFWIGGKVGELAVIDGYFFDFRDIKYDVENLPDTKAIFDWMNYMNCVVTVGGAKRINFESWCKGCPRPYTKEELDRLAERKRKKR